MGCQGALWGAGGKSALTCHRAEDSALGQTFFLPDLAQVSPE